MRPLRGRAKYPRQPGKSRAVWIECDQEAILVSYPFFG